ncbi:MAG: hypothetical protein ACK462_14820 [Planctomyces sp.]
MRRTQQPPITTELIARAWAEPIKGQGKKSPYRAGWTSIAAMLRHELAALEVRQAIVEMNVAENDIRNDGWIRSTARPRSPGVRLFFDSKYGPLRYECATWADWEHNVFAIARTLRAQRMIARDGAVKGDQVYAGWKALPSTPATPAAEFASVRDAMRWLSSIGKGDIVSELPTDLQAVYRAAARKAHPDAGGSDELMAKVNRARDFVERVGGAA